MALTGNLSNFRLGDILQTIWQNQTWGVLRVASGSQRRDLVVSPHGVAVLDICSVARARIEERLYHRGAITRESYNSLRKRENARRELTELLREIPGFDFSILTTCVESEAGEQLEALLEWESGTFELVEGEPPRQVAEATPRDTSSLLLEAARRQDEKRERGERFPSQQERYRLTEQQVENSDEKTNQFLTHIDGQSSARAIADRTFGDYFSTAKVLAEFEQGGYIQRLSWDELLLLGDELGKAQETQLASEVFELAVREREFPNDSALLDLAIRRTAAGDRTGAANTLASAAKKYCKSEEFGRAAACLRQAVELSPRETLLRREFIEVLFKDSNAEDSERYKAYRDYIVVCADRGEINAIDSHLELALPLIPEDSLEEARFGRALGLLNRKNLATQILIRAAVRAAKKDASLASSLYREALQFSPDSSEAKKGIESLLKAKNSKRVRMGAVAASVALIAAVAAVPIQSSIRDKTDWLQIDNITTLIKNRDFQSAISLVDTLESKNPSGPILEKCQSLRQEIASLSDERRQLEQSETDDWIREQFAAAASAIDARDYGIASELYEGILRKRNDDARKSLVEHRLNLISRKLGQEIRRISELVRTLQIASKGILVSDPPALRELQQLCSNQRKAQLEILIAKTETPPLNTIKTDGRLEPLALTVQKTLEAIGDGDRTANVFSARLEEAKELRDLEPVLLDGRAAETEGDPRAALSAFEQLAKRYRGSALKPYIEERVKYWTIVVHELTGAERAVAAGNSALANQHLATLQKLAPNVRHDALKVKTEIITIPAGAEIFVDQQKIGVAPAIVNERIPTNTKLEFRLAGYETAEYQIGEIPQKTIQVYLSPLPRWTKNLNAAPSSAGLFTNDLWILTDRRGGVSAFHIQSGETKWAVRVPTLEGVSGVPVMSRENVCVATREGVLYHLSMKDGSIVETKQIDTSIVSEIVEFKGRMLYINSKNEAVIFDPATHVNQRIQLESKATTAVSVNSESAVVGCANGSIVIIQNSGNFRVVTIQKDAIDYIEFVDARQILAGAGSILSMIDVETGTGKRTLELPNSIIARPAAGAFIFVPVGGQIVKIDKSNFTIIELLLAADSARIRCLSATENRLFVSHEGGSTVLSMNGAVEWKSAIGRRASFMSTSNSNAFFVGDGGELSVFSVRH
ncbi:MAG: DUF4388 domain-containing protein [Planctomycetota bacterium]